MKPKSTISYFIESAIFFIAISYNLCSSLVTKLISSCKLKVSRERFTDLPQFQDRGNEVFRARLQRRKSLKLKYSIIVEGKETWIVRINHNYLLHNYLLAVPHTTRTIGLHTVHSHYTPQIRILQEAGYKTQIFQEAGYELLGINGLQICYRSSINISNVSCWHIVLTLA